MGRIVNVRTSGRASLLRCRRRWGFTDAMGRNLEPKIKPGPFFAGSAMHFALEDYHGYKLFSTPAESAGAYAKAQKLARLSMPDADEAKALLELIRGMMDHYEVWLSTRDPLQTYVIDGVPQCEVSFKIPMTEELLKRRVPLSDWDIDEVYYTGTIDRMAIDREGQLWIVEYKSAKNFQLFHFETDRQVSAYMWAASCLFERPVVGVIYQQHRKTLPDSPKLLASGTYSAAKNQRTTHTLYMECLKNLYGKLEKAPKANIACLNELCMHEDYTHDNFIRRDFVYRSPYQIQAQGATILLEMEDYLNPNLPLYPNPTKDCNWDCSANTACVLMDNNGDWEGELAEIMTQRNEDEQLWRKHLLQLQNQ